VRFSGFANLRTMPPKPLVIFIEGLFREAMKITKGFQMWGQLSSSFSSSLKVVQHFCISSFPHHPLVVAVTSGNRLLFHALAVGAFIPAPLRSRNYVRSSLRNPYTPFCFHSCIHLSTPRHKYSFSHFIFPFPQSYPCQ